MVITKIKIGHQRQADKPIYLLPSGAIECGRFRYDGRYKKKFKSIYGMISDLAPTKPKNGVLDVSQYKYWDAVSIYQDYIVANWCKSVSAGRIEKFANESKIMLMIKDINCEFKRAVGMKWKREFKKSDPNSINTPRQAWQIL